MKYPCKKCGRPAAYLLEDNSGPCCYVPAPIGSLPKTEKASFTNDINARRAQIRWRKRGIRKPKTKREIEAEKKAKAATVKRWEQNNRKRRREYFRRRYLKQKNKQLERAA
jgi:hypothetical protein